MDLLLLLLLPHRRMLIFLSGCGEANYALSTTVNILPDIVYNRWLSAYLNVLMYQAESNNIGRMLIYSPRLSCWTTHPCLLFPDASQLLSPLSQAHIKFLFALQWLRSTGQH